MPCSSTTDAKVIHVESHPAVSAMQAQAIYHGAEMPETTSPSGAVNVTVDNHAAGIRSNTCGIPDRPAALSGRLSDTGDRSLR